MTKQGARVCSVPYKCEVVRVQDEGRDRGVDCNVDGVGGLVRTVPLHFMPVV